MTTSGVSHSKVSAIGDGGDTTLVRPSDWNDDHVISYVKPTGLTGATAASRYVGATTSGPPASGTFAVGDFIVDQTGRFYVCITAGSPGTWTGVIPDPVLDIFGAPSTAYEFDTSSLTGLTGFGSPTTDDADTTVPDHYYVKAPSANTLTGRYAATPSTPFTAIIKLASHNARANFGAAGAFIGTATPGRIDAIHVGYGTAQNIELDVWTNPTTYSSTPVGFGTSPIATQPLFLAFKVTTTTNIDYMWSLDGRIWAPLSLARDPSMTVGSVGMDVTGGNGGIIAASYEYLRIWTSGLTFPGI